MARAIAQSEGYGRIGVAEAIMLSSATLFGPGMFLFPGDLVAGASSGAWFGFALDAGSTVLAAWIWVTLARRHPARRLPELMGELIGTAPARILTGAVVLFEIAVGAIAVNALAQMVCTIFVPRTPLWAVEGAFLIVILYSVVQGIEVVGRTANFMLPLAWAAYILVYVMAMQTAQEPWNLVPHMPPGGFGAVGRGAYLSLWAFAATTALPNVLAHVSESEWGRMGSGVVLATLWDMGMRAMELVISLATLGVLGILWYRWPTVSVLRVVHTQGFLVNRLGAGLLVILVMLVGGFVAIHLWSADVNLVGVRTPIRALEHRSRDLTRLGSRADTGGVRAGLVAGTATLALSIWLNPDSRLHTFAMTWLNPSVLALSYLLPAVLLAVSLVRRGRQSEAGRQSRAETAGE